MKGGSNAEPFVRAELWSLGGERPMQYETSAFVDYKEMQETHLDDCKKLL